MMATTTINFTEGLDEKKSKEIIGLMHEIFEMGENYYEAKIEQDDDTLKVIRQRLSEMNKGKLSYWDGEFD